VQYKGSENADATTLLMPQVNYIGPTDPRWLSTMRAIRPGLFSTKLSSTQTTSVFSLRKSARVDSTWVIFHRPSPI
jgi:hypothetical protein